MHEASVQRRENKWEKILRKVRYCFVDETAVSLAPARCRNLSLFLSLHLRFTSPFDIFVGHNGEEEARTIVDRKTWPSCATTWVPFYRRLSSYFTLAPSADLSSLTLSLFSWSFFVSQSWSMTIWNNSYFAHANEKRKWLSEHHFFKCFCTWDSEIQKLSVCCVLINN